MNLRSRRSAVVVFFVITGAPIALLIYSSIALSTDSATRQAEKGAADSAQVSAVFIHERFQDVATQLDLFAQHTLAPIIAAGPGEYDMREVTAQLIDLTQLPIGVTDAFVTDVRGQVMAVASQDTLLIGDYLTGDDWYQNVSGQDGPYVAGLSGSVAQPNPRSVAIAIPIHSGAAAPAVRFGYLVGLYALERIQGFVDNFRRTRSTDISVVDSNGYILASPNIAPGVVDSWPGDDGTFIAAIQGHDGESTFSRNGDEHLAAYASVTGLRWVVVADIPKSVALRDADQLRTTVLTIAGVLTPILLVGVVSAWILVHQPARPQRGATVRVARPHNLGPMALTLLLLACLLSVGTWAALQQLPYVPEWARATSSAGAALVSIVGAAIMTAYRDRVGRRGEIQRQLRESFRFWHRGGGPRVADVSDPYQVGVHAAAWLADVSDAPQAPPYVPRTIDSDLDKSLRQNGLVLLVGSSTAGKSRSAFEAMRRCWPDRLLLVPVDRDALVKLKRLQIQLPDCVIWLDELDRYLGDEGMTAILLDWLSGPEHGQVVIVATMRASTWEAYARDHVMHRVERDVVQRARRIRLDRRLDDTERARASAHADDPRIARALASLDRYGLAEYLAAGPALLERLLNAVDEVQPVGVAIVRAAVDWQRAGLRRPAPTSEVERLHSTYLPYGDRRIREPEAFALGMTWATERIYGTASLLIEELDGNIAFDYVVDYFSRRDKEYPIPDRTWHLLLQHVTSPEEESSLGLTAYFCGQVKVAEELWRRAAENGHSGAAHNLAVLLEERGMAQSAQYWYRDAAKTGHAGAAYSLGAILERQQELDEAEYWYRLAAESGHIAAAYSLALLFTRTGHFEYATPWYRRAAVGGHAEAAFTLGHLLRDQADVEASESWYRRSAEAGHTGAAYELGVLLTQRGIVGEAEFWYRRAAEEGHPGAAQSLADLLMEHGKEEEAAWYLRMAGRESVGLKPSGTQIAAYSAEERADPPKAKT
jgi:TPR repeat protein